ncbi:protein subunit release factor A [Bacillus ectoiniformans]|uniref:YlqD family protein n=1 Tax=Bacillus ectoiniformans TaxID=1494429 RepID=UPI00195C4E4E|nr:YlqD family protein [Bacillus ectoiniformans]MBM7647155.1 protein subunit release factor A [Bacillus ectoiniformans]
MQIIQNVTVKQVLTEKTKHTLIKAYQAKITQLQHEISQFQFEQKKAEKQHPKSRAEAAALFEKELADRQNKINNIEFQMNQLLLLPLGSELKDGEVQMLTEVRVGDCWEEISKGKTIVVKEGTVIDIR